MEIAAGRAVCWKRGQLRAGFPSLGDFQIGIGTAHIRFDPAGMGRVDLYRGVAQFVGEMNGEGIQRGFRRVIGKSFVRINGRAGIGLERQ